jgi:hypothetical protein
MYGGDNIKIDLTVYGRGCMKLDSYGSELGPEKLLLLKLKLNSMV